LFIGEWSQLVVIGTLDEMMVTDECDVGFVVLGITRFSKDVPM
jgi:hypothetical protein